MAFGRPRQTGITNKPRPVVQPSADFAPLARGRPILRCRHLPTSALLHSTVFRFALLSLRASCEVVGLWSLGLACTELRQSTIRQLSRSTTQFPSRHSTTEPLSQSHTRCPFGQPSALSASSLLLRQALCSYGQSSSPSANPVILRLGLCSFDQPCASSASPVHPRATLLKPPASPLKGVSDVHSFLVQWQYHEVRRCQRHLPFSIIITFLRHLCLHRCPQQ